MPHISVIVPVYKVERYLPKCIDSILAQTYTDFELLLIDDGSPDRSGAICDEYATRDPRLRVFHKPNGGVSSARNLGLDNARGEWITFVDADDWITTNYLDNFFQSNQYYDLYIQGYRLLEKSGLIKDVRISKPNTRVSEIVACAEKKSILNSPVCKLFSAKIINDYNIAFDTRTSYGEDHLFVLDYLIHCNSVFCSPTIGYIYNHHENSLTTRVVPYKEILYYIDSLNDRICRPFALFCSESIGSNYKEISTLNLLRALQSFFCVPFSEISRKKYDDSFRNRLKEFYLNQNSLFTHFVRYASKINGPMQFVVMLLLFRAKNVIQRLRNRCLN